MSSPLAFISIMLISGAISERNRRKAENAHEMLVKEVCDYYNTFIIGVIFDRNEQLWIYDHKIANAVNSMSDKELIEQLKIKEKNNKLIKKNKPIKTEVVSKNLIVSWHNDYMEFKKRQIKEQCESTLRMQKETEERAIRQWKALAHKECIAENGESDTEIINKLF